MFHARARQPFTFTSAVLLGTLSLAAPAHADYRVFRLNITNQTSQQSRQVLSTLDHIQYPAFHPVGPDEQVSIASTWMCKRRSDYFTPYCPDPNSAASPSAIAPNEASSPARP